MIKKTFSPIEEARLLAQVYEYLLNRGTGPAQAPTRVARTCCERDAVRCLPCHLVNAETRCHR